MRQEDRITAKSRRSPTTKKRASTRAPSAAAASASAGEQISINRAPVLTLWAAVVAERLGHDRKTSLTLGRALAGLNAQSKGQRLGIFSAREPAHSKPGEKHARPAAPRIDRVELLGRSIPVVKTREGLRAAAGGTPDSPESVQRYLESKFGDSLAAARAAMKALAAAFSRDEIATSGFGLYEQFRPQIASGTRGWGAKGSLDLALVRRLAKR